jgi:tetratricopeptide (TPR) repeat protein
VLSPCPHCRANVDDAQSRCPFCTGRLKPFNISGVPPGGIFILAAVFGAAGFFAWRSQRTPRKSEPVVAIPFKPYEVSVKPPTRASAPPKPMYTLQELRQIRDLFETRRFDELDKAADDVQAAFERDPAYEYEAVGFFKLFRSARPGYEEGLDAWIAHSPAHFAPRLARANFDFNRGWASRGHDFAVKTSTGQFEGMIKGFGRAEGDISYALSINPRLLTAYTMRMSMFMADSDYVHLAAAQKEAAALFPTSFIAYSAALVTPRWGGSYRAMEAVALDAFPHVDKNPELYALFGAIYADQAWVFGHNKQFDRALEFYAKALLYGEEPEIYEERARTYMEMEDYDRARDDAERMIALRPTLPGGYMQRAEAYLKKNDDAAAMMDIRILLEQFPRDEETQDWLEWATRELLNRGHAAFTSDLELAISRYDKVLEMDPTSVEAHFWRGSAYLKLKKLDIAQTEMETTIKYDPRYFQAYRWLDYTLAVQGKWDEIIARWNEFLALEPNNADALLERAGTYHHKGDQKSAAEDLRRSCALGNQEACRLHKQFE